MRKVDYGTLARILRSESLSAKTWLDGECSEENKSIAHARINTVTRITMQFARDANVNKTEFLKACGIE